jgi:hypothetical protein
MAADRLGTKRGAVCDLGSKPLSLTGAMRCCSGIDVRIAVGCFANGSARLIVPIGRAKGTDPEVLARLEHGAFLMLF